jgi:acyl-[acyl-carrier-protein]-phospholipid O-acyltransferase / long-chain-fatty-acid--[acyl-carrier-protein] ligase
MTSTPLSQILLAPQFWPYYGTQFLRVFNDNFFKNALVMIFTYQIGRESGYEATTLLSLQAAIFILPYFLFSTIAGQVADKYNKAMLARRIKLIEIILSILGGIGLILAHIELLLVVLFLFGTLATFFGPVKYGILPDLLERPKLLAGNSLVEVGTLIGVLLGTATSGLVPVIPHGPYWAAGFVLLIAVAGYAFSLRMHNLPARAPDLVISWKIIGDTKRLLASAKQNPHIWNAIILISWFWFLGAALITYIPALVRDELGAGATVVTSFYMIFSCGVAIGSLLCQRILQGAITQRLVPISAAMMTVGMLGFYALVQLWPTACVGADCALLSLADFMQHGLAWAMMAALLLLALGGGLFIVPLNTIVQHQSTDSTRARMIAADNVMNSLFMVTTPVISLGLLALGLAVSEFLALYGILNILLALWMKARWQPIEQK